MAGGQLFISFLFDSICVIKTAVKRISVPFYCGGFVSSNSEFLTLRIQVCPKKGIGPLTFLFFSDGIGARKILFDREGSGYLG